MTHRSTLLLVGITLLGLLLRLNGVDDESIWLDEAICWRDVHASWPDFIETLRIGECMPPLYFALLKLWTGLVGESSLALRLPSVAFGTLTVPLLGWLVRRLAGPGAGCLAALFLAVAPFHVYYSQEARPYAFYPFIVLAATAALAWALETGKIAAWKKGATLPQAPFFLFGVYGFLALLAWYSDTGYALSTFRALAAIALMFWALERWKGKRTGQFEIYAFLGALAFCSRFFFNHAPLLFLGLTAAAFFCLEYVLQKPKDGRRDWRFGIYAFLAVVAYGSHHVHVLLPLLVLGATAAAFWALEIRQGRKGQGRAQIYAFLVLLAFCNNFYNDGVSFGVLCAAVPLCWALEKRQRSSSGGTETANDGKTATPSVPAPLPPAPAAARAFAPSRRVRLCVYVFLALLACYTHYFAAFFMAAHGAFVALVCWTERSLRPARDWVLCMTAVGIGFLPWLPFMLRFDLNDTNWVAYFLRQWSPLMQFWFAAKTLVFSDSYPMWLGNEFPDAVLVMSPLAVWLAYRRSQESGVSGQESGVRGQELGGGGRGREDGNQHAGADSALTSQGSGSDICPSTPEAFALALLCVMTIVPLLVAWTFSQFRTCLVPRYVIPVVPAVMALLAVALWRMRWLVPRVVLAGALAVYLFVCVVQQSPSWTSIIPTSTRTLFQLREAHPSRAELNLVAAYIDAHLEPGDGIIVEPAQQYLVLRYYLGKRMPTVINEADAFVAPEDVVVPDDLADSLAQCKRVWYVRQYTSPSSPIESYLDAHYVQAEPARNYFRVPSVKLYVVRR